ncbi:hypothetical protein BKA93DRAFT_728071 [Sparassis latifolia]
MESKETRTNVSSEMIQQLTELIPYLSSEGLFGHEILQRVKLHDVSVYERPEDGKTCARVVFRLTVEHDMLNVGGSLHGGCGAFLVDICSSMALWALGVYKNDFAKEESNAAASTKHVSQAINMLYHGGTHLGAELEIVNTTTSWGKRILTARTEIWDATNRRLVASGTHVKMEPSTKL